MRYRIYLEPDEDGVYVATCPALPGCISQGQTRAEATDNIREAIEGRVGQCINATSQTIAEPQRKAAVSRADPPNTQRRMS